MGTALLRARPMGPCVLTRTVVTIVAIFVASPTLVAAQDAGVDAGSESPSEPTPVGEGDAGVEAETDPADAGAETPAPLEPVAEPEPVVSEPEPVVVPDPETPRRISDAATAIEVHVIDHATGEPLIEATVIAEANGQRVRGYTDDEGNVTLEVTPGLWTVRAFTDYYREARHRPIRVRVGQRPRATMRLREADSDALVFEVVERADRRSDAVLTQERMNSSVSQDTQSGAAMARTGATTAARGAARIVGVSLDSNTLIVRGLGDRYTNVLMNGVFLPGTDPDRNGVQLDVIPAAAIANISIIKTFQPQIPANWAGGLAVIESASPPDTFTVRLTGSLGLNTVTTGRQTLDNRGSVADVFGFGLRSRSLSSLLPSYYAARDVMRPDGTLVTRDEAAAFGRTLPRNWEIFRSREAPNGTLSFSIGDSIRLRQERRFGYLLGLNYNRTANVRRSERVVLIAAVDPNDPTIVQTDTTFAQDLSIEEVLVTAFGTANLRYSSSGDIRLLGMYTQNSTDETRNQIGNTPEFDVEARQIQYVQRSVSFTQLIGQQRGIPWFTDEPARVNYSAYFASSRRDEPMTRRVRYQRDVGTSTPFSLADNANGADILELALSQREYGGYVHFDLPLYDGGQASVGTDMRLASRESAFRQFHYGPYQADQALLEQPLNSILVPENIDGSNGPIRFSETTLAQNQYVGALRWFAGFATADLRFTDWLRLAGGVRLESMHREVRLESDIFGIPTAGVDPNNASVSRTNLDVLPGVSLIFSPTDSMNVRAS